MNFLSMPFILSIIFGFVIWITTNIKVATNGLSSENLKFDLFIMFGFPVYFYIWYLFVKNQNKKTEDSLENYRQQELQTENGKACQWLLNNINKINWSFGNFGMYFGNSKKYKVIIDHMCFSINGIKYQYIGSISESKILNLIELEIDYQKNKIKRNQKLEDINE